MPRRLPRLAPLALIACLTIRAAPAHASSQPPPDPHQHYRVAFVLDGDTIDVSGVGRVRLLGIDAPERAFGFDTPEPFAEEARAALTSLLAGRWVTLRTDIEVRDRYARVLAYVERDDGLLVNAAMLRAGLARVTAREPLRLLDALRQAEADAQRGRRGMWGARPSLPWPSFRVPATPPRAREGARPAPR